MESISWWAKGLVFENCNCQLVCPGHIHFDQQCTHERCKGYWAIVFEDGEVGATRLAGSRVVIAYDTPQRMITGGWTQVMIVDEEATEPQRNAIENIFTGKIGGPWEILARFVERRLPTRFLPIEITSEPMRKKVTIPGLLQSVVQTIRGSDRSEPVRFENIFNQIHNPSQVLARGESRYDDGTIRFDMAKTHGLWSEFSWRREPDYS